MNAQRTDASIVYELLTRYEAHANNPMTHAHDRKHQRENYPALISLKREWDERYATGQDA